MIFLYYGPDSFSIQEAVERQLRAALPAEMADMNLTRMAAEEVTVDALRFACEAMPFLADRRAVVVQGLFHKLTTRRQRGGQERSAEASAQSGEREPKLVTEIAGYLPFVPENTLLILVEPDAPPKTGPLAKAIEAAMVKQQPFPLLSGTPLVRWIKERVRAGGGQMSERAVNLLATYCGGDLRALSHEIQKLMTYAGPGHLVDVAEVELLVSQVSEGNIFAFVDAIGTGNRKQALTYLHVLMEQGERPERIMGMVARQVRLLLQAKDLTARRAAPDELARQLGLAPYPLRKITEQVRLFTLPVLELMHARVLEADLQIKTGLVDPDLALELLVAELAARARPASRPAGGAQPVRAMRAG